MLRQALRERIKPVLFINNIDNGIHLGGESMYQQFKNIIEKTNVIISTYENKDIGESMLIDPVNGSVAFGSAQ